MQNALSIEEAVLNAIAEHLPALTQPKFLVGLSEINYKILLRLRQQGIGTITLCNRSDQKASGSLLKEGISFLPWDQLHDCPCFDGAIVATKSPHFLALPSHIKNDHPQMMIDLSVPRNIDPQLPNHFPITLLNVDQLNQVLDTTRKFKAQEIGRLKTSLIAQAVERQTSLFSSGNCAAPLSGSCWLATRSSDFLQVGKKKFTDLFLFANRKRNRLEHKEVHMDILL